MDISNNSNCLTNFHILYVSSDLAYRPTQVAITANVANDFLEAGYSPLMLFKLCKELV